MEIDYFGFDRPAVRITFERNGRRLILESWHATYRKNPKIVATASGLTPVDNEGEKQKILAKQPIEYLRFVHDFDAILNSAEKLVGPFDL